MDIRSNLTLARIKPGEERKYMSRVNPPEKHYALSKALARNFFTENFNKKILI